jgi:hypothetical protein
MHLLQSWFIMGWHKKARRYRRTCFTGTNVPFPFSLSIFISPLWVLTIPSATGSSVIFSAEFQYFEFSPASPVCRAEQ